MLILTAAATESESEIKTEFEVEQAQAQAAKTNPIPNAEIKLSLLSHCHAKYVEALTPILEDLFTFLSRTDIIIILIYFKFYTNTKNFNSLLNKYRFIVPFLVPGFTLRLINNFNFYLFFSTCYSLASLQLLSQLNLKSALTKKRKR